MYSLYHIARADFLQRVRSPLFLLTLGVCLYAAYTFVPSPEADYITVRLGNYRGLYNATWVGHMVAMMCSVFLSLFGFYLVNNSVKRDYETGLGQIIATTQVSKLQYLMGKALSNFAVLLTIVLAVAGMATVLLLLYSETGSLTLWQLYLPFLWIPLPALFFIACLAAVAESFRRLNAGLVNILYFIGFMFFLGNSHSSHSLQGVGAFAFDLFGVENSFHLLKAQLSQQVSDYSGGQSIGFLHGDGRHAIQTVEFAAVSPSPLQLLYRLYWLGLAGLLLVLGAAAFRRFDPAYETTKRGAGRAKGATGTPTPYSRLPLPRLRFSTLPLLLAEARLMLRGQSHWWWLATGGLFVATFFVDLQLAHQRLLLLLWLLQVLVWSALGSREKINQTEQLLFAAPHVLSRQLLASWGAAVLWALLLAAGVLLRSALAGEVYAAGALLAAVFFLPSLAIFAGILTGGGKLFQVVLLILCYGVFQGMPYVDFMGAVAGSREWGLPYLVAAGSAALLAGSLLGRKRQSGMPGR
ncbi:ABC transporter permease [Cesiribacter andamanensis]|uniref:ABC-2 family transporter protein n=1 Tax=Cesiribacter andamanensis AMV16 TaxID=1279009 RepID=M7N9R6_9BACT|nr:ABC transporter permease subunit [Cesiribacter andamanensis]EMR04012.1 ABC-2 family transporter protein [Cesiribacter andamanensis AMV16]